MNADQESLRFNEIAENRKLRSRPVIDKLHMGMEINHGAILHLSVLWQYRKLLLVHDICAPCRKKICLLKC